MANLDAFSPIAHDNGTLYSFLNSEVAFTIVRDLHYRINAIQKAGTPQADTYFARCFGESSVLTNVPLIVVNSAVMCFRRVAKSLNEQIESAKDLAS